MKDIEKLIEKYAVAGPRYTSYPTALSFSESADKERLAELAASRDAEASLYVHIPFCRSLCWFCGCTSSVCTDAAAADPYLGLLDAELALWRDSGLGKRKLKQLHFGGGTPNFLTPEQIMRLGGIIEKYFSIDKSDCEFSCEMDPRTLTAEKVKAFADIGVNRASIGVQDTNPETQKAINRVQPQSKNLEAAEWLRSNGITNINVDLIYGLPLQTAQTFKKTLSDTLDIGPDRIALFGYAHVPWAKPSQKLLEKNAIPSPEKKVRIFLEAKEFFENADYEYIGLDHFAKPGDPLIKARQNGSLHRNFQGYSTRAGLDTMGIGLTSISETRTSYRQNFKLMEEYSASVLGGKLPIERGIILGGDDIIRRGIIMDVMCSLKVSYCQYGVDFKTYFADAIKGLGEMEKDGLVEMRGDGFEVTSLGRLFLRNIAMLFDGRLSQGGQRYSKTV